MQHVSLRERRDGELTFYIVGMDQALKVPESDIERGRGLKTLYSLFTNGDFPIDEIFELVPLEIPDPGGSSESDLLTIAVAGRHGLSLYVRRFGPAARRYFRLGEESHDR